MRSVRVVAESSGYCTLVACLATPAIRADELQFTYDGDTIPGEPASGLQIDDPCEPDDCTLTFQSGRLVLEWSTKGEEARFSDSIALLPEPPPPTLWLEWRFRSNQPRPSTSIFCDGVVFIQYSSIVERVNLFQDVVFDGGGGLSASSSPEFHTYRFEGVNGTDYTLAVDGVLFKEFSRDGTQFNTVFSFGGEGGCGGPRPDPVRNEWDFVRYGTLSNGEQLVSSDPPAGNLTPSEANQLSRIVLTFDRPAYLYVDDIAVTTTGGMAPTVTATRRLDNGAPEVLEVVLKGVLPPGETTTFTFDTGTGPQSVSYFRTVPEIPTTSTWGIVATGVLALVAGAVLIPRRECRH